MNSHSSVRYWTPFGGYKQSGLGRELGPTRSYAFTEDKNVFIATGGVERVAVAGSRGKVSGRSRVRRAASAGQRARASSPRAPGSSSPTSPTTPGDGARGRARRAMYVHVDVTDQASVAGHVRRGERRLRRDRRRCSTTPASRRPTTTRSSTPELDAWRRVQEVNLTSRLPVLQVRHPAPARARRRARSSTRPRSSRCSARRPRRSPTRPRRAACCRCRASSACSSPARASG